MQVLVPLYMRTRWFLPSKIVAFVPVEVLPENPYPSDGMYDASIYEMAAHCSAETRKRLAFMGIHIECPIVPNPVPSHNWDSPSDIMWVPGYNAPGVKTEPCLGQKSNEKPGLRRRQAVRIARKLLWRALAGTKSSLEKLNSNVAALIAVTKRTISRWISIIKPLRRKVSAFLRKCRNLRPDS